MGDPLAIVISPRGAGGLVSREQAEGSVAGLLDIAHGKYQRGGAVRVSALRCVLEQYRWEQERQARRELEELTDEELELIVRAERRALAP